MFINVRVKTKQRESKIEKLEDGSYKILVRAIPTKNKANFEVIDLLANHFHVTKSQIKIKSGKYSPEKRVYIDDQIQMSQLI